MAWLHTLVLVPIAGLFLGGCAGPSSPPEPAAGPASPPRDAGITLDGEIGDWNPEMTVVADAEHLFFRVKVEGEMESLQGMRRPLLARFDLDGNGSTGARYATPQAAQGFGVDLEIVFSPKAADDERGLGVAANAVGPDGRLRPIPHHELDLIFAPTHAAEWYEARLSVWDLLEAGLPRPEGGGAGSGSAVGVGRMIFVLGDGAGGVAGWAPPAEFRWPGVVEVPARADVAAPARTEGAIRILSWNVGRSGPSARPEPFARVIRALEPDILLLQEWDEPGAPGIGEWFTAHVAGETPWSVVKGAGRGVTIVARGSAAPLGPGEIRAEESDYPVRFVGAMIQTAHGPVAVGSAHLKCCGWAGSAEDATRMLEAEAINEAMAAALAESAAEAVIIGGDFNLVGSRPPLDMLRAGLDTDGTELAVAEVFTLGDETQVTWSSDGAAFTPGRLDYLLYSDASVEVEQAFALDTRRLDDVTLDRLGLEAGDAHASDHRPIVIDVRPR